MNNTQIYTTISTLCTQHGITGGKLCDELGHAATGALHKVDSPFETVGRSEYRANRWSAEHFLTVQDFQDAFSTGYTELWQLAEYFDLPEQDIKNALSYWMERKEIDFNL